MAFLFAKQTLKKKPIPNSTEKKKAFNTYPKMKNRTN